MKSRRLKTIAPVGLTAVALLLAPYAHGQTQAEQTPDEIAARLQMLKQQVEQQTRQLDALKRSVAEQEASLNDVRRAVAKEVLATQRGGQAASGAAPAPAAQQAQAQAPGGDAPAQAQAQGDAPAQGQAPTTPVANDVSASAATSTRPNTALKSGINCSRFASSRRTGSVTAALRG